MQRLFEAGLTVLLMTTFGVPVQAMPESEQSSSVQPAIEQPTQAVVEAKQVSQREEKALPEARAEASVELSERDRIHLEHYLQRPLPVGVVSDQVTGY